MRTEYKIEDLIVKYLRNELKNREREFLFQWVEQSDHNKSIFEQVTTEELIKKEVQTFNQFDLEAARKNIKNQIQFSQSKPVVTLSKKPTIWLKNAAAAAIIILLFAGGYFWFTRLKTSTFHKPEGAGTSELVSNIAPGGNRAVLILEDGSSISLDSATNGTVAKQGAASIQKVNNGRIAYKLLNEKPTITLYNELRTPRGGQYQLSLPDGSQVWLNAASSIRYPVFFTGNERRVEITGETYFEVKHDASKPFHVKVNDMDVEVLGTHFSINSYRDEPVIKTTLLEGAVKVTSGQAIQKLLPGQQSQLNQKGELSILRNINVEDQIAWKNGIIHIDNSDIQNVMRQLARWYDVDVLYEGTMNTKKKIEGDVERNIPLNQLLENLQKVCGMRFQLEGKTIKVLPSN